MNMTEAERLIRSLGFEFPGDPIENPCKAFSAAHIGLLTLDDPLILAWCVDGTPDEATRLSAIELLQGRVAELETYEAVKALMREAVAEEEVTT